MASEKEFITENPFAILVRRMNRIESQNEQILSFLQGNNSKLAPDKIGGMALATKVTGLSDARIYTLVSERKIPHSKRGNRLFFRESQLEAWIAEGNRKQTEG